jgi:hypothetical protein
MAHIRHHHLPVDRAPLRTAADTWHSLALATLTWLAIAPALVIGVLLIAEALLPPKASCGTVDTPLACTAEVNLTIPAEPSGPTTDPRYIPVRN